MRLITIILLLTLCISTLLPCERTATVSIKNAHVSGDIYSFEVWGQNTSANLISVEQCGFTFKINSSAFDTVLVTPYDRYAIAEYKTYGYLFPGELHICFVPRNVDHQLLLSKDEEFLIFVQLHIVNHGMDAQLKWDTTHLTTAFVPRTGPDKIGMTFLGADNSSLPVQLRSFGLRQISSGVRLEWITLSETNNYGFHVQRNGQDIAFVPGHGTTLLPYEYSYIDGNAESSARYRLRQVDLDGTSTYCEEISLNLTSVPEDTPTQFTLTQNYPNPFNPTTEIPFSLPQSGHVVLSIYNVLGQEVSVLINEQLPPGEHKKKFRADQLPSGAYMYVLYTPYGRLSGKMLLSK